jgi:hypothetical protein
VQNSDIDQFFKRHGDLFPKPKKVGNNDWADSQRVIEERYGPVDFWYGRCFHAAKFMEYHLNSDQWTLMCIRKFVFCDLGLKTTHWYLKHNETGEICDPSASQFIYGIKPPYHLGRRANFGNPYFGSGKKKSKRYDKVVPTHTVMAFAKAWFEEGTPSEGLQWWLREYNVFYGIEENS